MLELKNITKTYVSGELRQDALKEISVSFRKNEFVAVLGQSGSGKTTMLNIIGGLDRYTDGDLIINGVSTKEYTDSDWDSYRNHSVGFVFQSYNLIPHQTVLSNVEMALTLAGVPKKERRERATEVLKKVGLADHIHKKPNQMSGGQMQRVAIARALVNNPDILLADEPTGALDSETSVQIMELLKEIAKDKLVIMVTHNPELAEKYSTRTVLLLDGHIISDSDPYENEDVTSRKKPEKKVSMPFATALSLSFNNLRTKKGRTLLTAFAGSIGVIGIALIVALSSGMNDYIDNIQKDTMSSYPITIDSSALDIGSVMNKRAETVGNRSRNKETEQTDRTEIYADFSSEEADKSIESSFAENDLTSFKKYLDSPECELNNYIGENGITYTYDTNFTVYSKDANGNIVKADGSDGESDGRNNSPQNGKGILSRLRGASGSSTSNPYFSELPSGTAGKAVSDGISENYDILCGRLPENGNEVVLVTNADNSIPLKTLYLLGFITREEYDETEQKIKNGEQSDDIKFSYEDVCKQKFYLVPACDNYEKDENGIFSKKSDTVFNGEIPETAFELTVTGVLRPKTDAANANIETPIAYTSLLTDQLIEYTDDSEIVTAQESTPDINILTGLSFSSPDDDSKIADAKEYLGNLGISDKASFYKLMMYYSQTNEKSTDAETNGNPIPASSSFAGQMPTDEASMAAALDNWLANSADNEILLKVYDEYIAGATYRDNMKEFGKVNRDAPSSIKIYTDSFENKDAVAACIESYNETVSDGEKITYTDYAALLTSSVSSIINGISYVLIAFVAISLIVSCIMIGIITNISVMERTKEIGILRSLGASKRNISQVFNAETFIIGCCAGVIGIGISILALFPINAVIERLSGISDLTARLPVSSSLLLVAVSIIITILGGLLPAKNAANKDPVTALRTE